MSAQQHSQIIQDKDWIALQHWYQQIAQQRYSTLQSDLLAPILPTLPGQTIVALGVPATDNFLQSSHIAQHIYIDTSAPLSQHVDLFGNFEQLPIANDAVDVVVIPHLLEFAAYPTTILREVERILAPAGHIVITGFNPFCLWRLNHSLSNQWTRISHKLIRLKRPHKIDINCCWQARWLPPGQLKLWLAPLGFELVNLAQQRWRSTTKQGLNLSLKAYALVAKKHVFTLTPIKPQRQWQRHHNGKLAAAGLPQTQTQSADLATQVDEAMPERACSGNLAKKINS